MPPGHHRALTVLPDRDLVAMAVTGDRRAYGELVRRHTRTVFDLLRRMGASPALAADVTQDAFVAALTDLGHYRGDAPFGAWLRTVAARALFRRRRKDSRLLLLEPPVEGVYDLDPAIRLDIDRALATLAPAERICVSLSHAAGFSHPEIAEALDMPIGTVKSHIARGLVKLRSRLSSGDLP